MRFLIEITNVRTRQAKRNKFFGRAQFNSVSNVLIQSEHIHLISEHLIQSE